MSYEIITTSYADDWLGKRAMGIGSSDAAAILNESPWKSAFGLWCEKTGQIEAEDLDAVERIFWGKELEAAILRGYEKRTGRPVRPAGQLLRSTVHPWALCTLDGETKVEPVAPWSILEVKNTNEFAADAWTDGAPEHYRIQAHWQMLVTGAPMATIAVLIGGHQLAWQDIQRDETLIRKLVFHGERFWQMVTDRKPPPIDGSKAAANDLARAYPADDGEVIGIPDEIAADVAALKGLRSTKGEIEKAMRLHENRIKAAMGAATEGHTADGLVVTLKTTERAGYTVKPSSFRAIRIKEAG
jgi:putative phage-type endonuclease